MNDTLAATAATIRYSAEALDQVSRRLPGLDPGPDAFGAGAPGALGELGRALHALWRQGLHARAGEAQAFAACLDQVSDRIMRAGWQYQEADDTVQRRFREGW